MTSGLASLDRDAAAVAVAQIKAGYAALAQVTLSPEESLQVLDELESVHRAAPVVDYQLLFAMTSQASPTELGATSWKGVLATRLRITEAEATTRLKTAADLGPRRAVTGEVLGPLLAGVAAGQAAGLIGAEHVTVIRTFFKQLPVSVGLEERCEAEATLARVASEFCPDGLRASADLLMAVLHPDGDFTEADRARRRQVTFGKQHADGMSTLTGVVDPEFRATFEPILAKLAAPGMANPADPEPCLSGTPSQTQITGDQRSAGQRCHDAFIAAGAMVLASGGLGQLNGLPVTIIVNTTLQQLQAGAGLAVTAGGTRIPMRDLITMASDAYHYLAVFDQHTAKSLYLGRARRCASAAQRIMLLAKHRGCTCPGCTVAGYWCQAHHLNGFATGTGQTDIDEMTLACPPNNRMIETTGWTTRRRADGRTEWIPPPHLDTGQARINDLHHPEYMLWPDEPDDSVGQGDEPDNPGDESGSRCDGPDPPNQPDRPDPPENNGP